MFLSTFSSLSLVSSNNFPTAQTVLNFVILEIQTGKVGFEISKHVPMRCHFFARIIKTLICVCFFFVFFTWRILRFLFKSCRNSSLGGNQHQKRIQTHVYLPKNEAFCRVCQINMHIDNKKILCVLIWQLLAFKFYNFHLC